jgi:hypothetical protein
MTSQLMNHEEAISRLAAERYLLGEMEEQERAAFEAHYLNCAKCLEDVTFGDEFMQVAAPVARELAMAEAGGRTSAPVRASGSFLGWLRNGLTSPAPALAMAVVVVGLGIVSVYQTVIVQKQKNVIAELKAPRQEFRFTVAGQARKEQEPAVYNVRPDEQITIKFEFQPGHTRYEAELSSADGKFKWVKSLALADYESSATISVPAEALPGGKYSAVLRAQSPTGNQAELANGSFELKFAK